MRFTICKMMLRRIHHPAVSSKVRRSSQTFLFELKSGMEYLRNIFHDNSELQDPPLPSLGTTKTLQNTKI